MLCTSIFHFNVHNDHPMAQTKSSLLNSEMCSRSSDITAEYFSEAILQKRYADVKYILSPSVRLDPNVELNFLGEIYMTPLEFSVIRGDWEMALLLFLNGADPMFNCFDGTIKSCHELPFLNSIQDSFKKREFIPGFEGLRALVQQDDGDSKAITVCLRLMEILHGDIHLDSSKDTTLIMEYLSILFQDLASIHEDKQEILYDGIDYICTCCERIRAGINSGVHSDVLDDELFELVMFSLRIIVRDVISSQNGYNMIGTHAYKKLHDTKI